MASDGSQRRAESPLSPWDTRPGTPFVSLLAIFQRFMKHLFYARCYGKRKGERQSPIRKVLAVYLETDRQTCEQFFKKRKSLGRRAE